ncbi:MAG: FGGY family carbohydrate kinase [Pseudomonadota bacterium]
MADPLLVGIDAGTSGIRALVFSLDGQLMAEASGSVPLARPHPGWAEHDPHALWDAARGAIRAATEQLDDPGRIIGVAAASVGEAFVALDRAGQPLGPVIAWYDERPRAELDWLSRTIGFERLHALCGLSPDPTFTLCKLLWLRANHPELLASAVRWLNVTHYLAWRLCGEMTCDPTLASRTLAFDLHQRVWADDLIAEIGLSRDLFAPIRPNGARLGEVTSNAAAETGLPKGCAVGVGGHDHIIGALVLGALGPGIMFNSLGTAEAATATLPRPSAQPELLRLGYSQGTTQVEAEEPVTYLFGGFPTSGACIEWFRSLFDGVDHDTLIQEAGRVPAGCHGVTFVPDLRGRISPIPDPLARGAWFGLAADTVRGGLYRAVLEGIAFESRQTLDSLGPLGVPAIHEIRAIGGNTKNSLLMQIKASVYRQAVKATELAEVSALGAALMGGLAAGAFKDLAEGQARLQPSLRTIEPVEPWVGRYDVQYRKVYRPAYAALRDVHHAADEIEQGGRR